MILQVGQPSDMLLQDPPCVLEDSEIITENGFKKACDIIVGDKVLTHTGTFKKVMKVYKRAYNGNLTYIENNVKNSLILTDKHPVLTYETDTCYCKKMVCKPNCRKQYSSYMKNGRTCKKSYDEYSESWINSEDLIMSNYLLFPKLDKIYDNNISNNFSDKEMWLFGLWLADGDYSNGIRYNLGTHEKDLIEKVIFLFKEIYNLDPHISYGNTNDSCIRIVFYSKKLSDKFFNMFNHGAGEKKIPFEFIFMNNYKLQTFVDGMVDGDGHRRKNRNKIEYYTSSNGIKKMLILILRKLGFNPSITLVNPKDSCIEGRIIRSNLGGYSFSWSFDKQKNIGGWFDNKYIVNRPKKIIKNYTQIECIVYNFEVEDDNSYIANDITVHNCLRHIDTRIQDGKLHFYPYFRSWDLWGGLPANLGGIQLMKEYIASEIGVEDGEIIASSKGLHLYDYSFDLAKCLRMRDDMKLKEGKI
jgi:intein/homing endonuclease